MDVLAGDLALPDATEPSDHDGRDLLRRGPQVAGQPLQFLSASGEELITRKRYPRVRRQGRSGWKSLRRYL
jgi:hypothetical protein